METFWKAIDDLKRDLSFSSISDSFRENNFNSVQHKSGEEIRQIILRKIEEIIENCVESPVITFVNRNKWENVDYQPTLGLKMKEETVKSVVKFSSLNSMKRFTLILHVLAKIYYLVQTNTYSTKRELYYQDINIFDSQNTLNTIIDDISCLLKVPRNYLHIMATSKGCVTGNLRFQDGEKNYIDCYTTVILIPRDVDNITNIISDAKFILVIEKDATFQKLLDENIIINLSPCIIITGKGFPDVNTRKLIHKLWDTLRVPILVLADADPHGIEIVCVYKFGSLSLAYESSHLAVPCLKWIGIHPTDIERLPIPENTLLPLTKQDINKANALLQRVYIQQNPEWEHQVKTLLNCNKKAEIQSLCGISDRFLCNVYLPAKIRLGGWI